MIKNPLLSIIIPIYNVDRYLEEAIDSLISQSIGFEDNIQLILVNDGSPDNSESICIKYRDRYPNNVTYIRQKNGGVSSARNKGLNFATGKFVHFMDPDDIITKNTYKSAVELLNKHKSLEVVSIPIYFFGAMKGPHPNNNKFDGGTRVVDMSSKETTFIQSNVATVILRRSAIKDLRFDKKLKFGEDGKFINEILCKKPKIGLIADAGYYYRKRGDGTSAVDGMLNNHGWYFDLLERYIIYIAKKSIKTYGHVPRYIQNVIFHDLRWRFEQKDIRPGVLSDVEKEKYKSLIKKALQYVDDKIIAEMPLTRKDLRVYMLQFKHGDKNLSNIEAIRGGSLDGVDSVHVDVVESDDSHITIEGRYTDTIGDTKISAVYGNLSLPVKSERSNTAYVTSMGDKYKDTIYFKLTIPVDKLNETDLLDLSIKTKDIQIKTEIQFEYNSRLSNLNNSFKTLGRTIVSVVYVDGLPKILFENISISKLLKKEINVSLRIIMKKDILSFGARVVGFLIRFISTKILKKQIWILSDRPLLPTDNAYSMFKYINSLSKKSVIPFLVVSKQSPLYKEVKRVGPVVAYEGILYRVLSFASSVILSSHFDISHNPFGHMRGGHMRIGFKSKFVYLQHGVLASDLSMLISKTKINSSLITVSSNREKQSILQNKEYGYEDKDIAITGQARFDELLDKSKNKKIIAFAPTWRFNLFLGPKDEGGKVIPGLNKLNTSFSETEYCKYYNSLINDSRILEAMERKGFTGVFYVHPQIAVQKDDFKGNSRIIVETEFDYTDALRDSSMLVTDYSGIAFDFAYMKKPLIYSQFDKDAFYSNHTYNKGYFSFDNDGFGPVTYDYESTVKLIVDTISSNMKMQSKYLRRVDDFFDQIDNNNCKRIYNNVINL
jgi:glycosyltransferase involved in cell wall biosynthesis